MKTGSLGVLLHILMFGKVSVIVNIVSLLLRANRKSLEPGQTQSRFGPPDSEDLVNYTDWYIFAPVTKAERTRNHIIETTAPLFNMRGYEGTSLEDLCQATGLTKGALYGNFENKDELFAAAFQYAVRRVREEGKKHVDLHTTNKGRLLALMQFFSTYVMSPPLRGGCPLLNNAVDADDHRPRMKKAVARELERSIAYIAGMLDDGKSAGEFKRTFDSRQTAMLFFCAIEGAIMFSRVSASDEAMRAVTTQIKQIVNSIESDRKTK